MSDRLDTQDIALGNALAAEQARRLRSSSERIVPGQRALAGRFVALMCRSPFDPAAQRLMRAASELGLQVTQVAPPFEGQRIDALARILDQLYDAVDCTGMAHTEVQQLARACRVPVFDGLAGADNPLAALASPAPDAPAESAEAQELHHRRLVQAALLESLCGAETFAAE